MAKKGLHWTADEKNDCYCCLIWICIYSSRRISKAFTTQPTYVFTGKAKIILTENTVGKLSHPRGTTIDEASKGN